MQHTRARQLEREEQRLLELVVHTSSLDSGLERLCERRVRVVRLQEAERRKRLQISLGFGSKQTKVSWTYPRRSRNRQMTFATISSFFSSGRRSGPTGGSGLRVRTANCSSDVADRHNAKSIVEDYGRIASKRIVSVDDL